VYGAVVRMSETLSPNGDRRMSANVKYAKAKAAGRGFAHGSPAVDDMPPQVMCKAAASLTDDAGMTVQALIEAHELAERIDAKLFGAGLKEKDCGMPPAESLASQIDEGRSAASGLVKRLSAILDRL